MKKKAIALTLTLALMLALVPVTALAGGSGIIVRITYIDVRRDEDPNIHLEGKVDSFEPNAIDGDFVFEAPDGSELVITNDMYIPSYTQAEHFQSSGCYWSCWYNIEEGMAGKYTISDYPVPEGFEIVRVSGASFTLTQEILDDEFALVNENIYIFIKPVGTDTAQPPVNSPDEPPIWLVAKPSNQSVLVNGEAVAFDAYNIDGSNYFKLRDLAFVLSGTDKQFEIGWDAETATILLVSGEQYTPNGSEMAAKGDVEKTPVVPTLTVTLDGEVIELEAYNIDGNNYFKIRDFGAAMDIFVDYDDAARAVIIDTTK